MSSQQQPVSAGPGRRARAVLFAAFFLSLLGDGVVSSLVLDAAASGWPVAVTAVFLAELVPPLLLAPRIGRWVDRVPLRRTWTASLAALCAVSALSAALDVLAARIALVGLASVFAVAASACVFTAVPRVAGPAGFSRINGVLASTRSVASLAAPALGGVAHLTVGTTGVLIFDAVSFAILAAAVAALFASAPASAGSNSAPTEPPDRPDVEPAGRRPPVAFASLRASPVVASLVPIVAGVVLATSVEGVAGVFWLREVSGNSVVYGLVLAAWAAGSVPGALLAGHGVFGDVEHRLIIVGAGAMAAVFLAVPFITAPAVLAALFVLGGAGNAAHNVGLTNALHRFVPADQHGQAWAQLRVVINSCVVLGYLAGTPNDLLGPRTLIFVSGLLAAAVTLYGLRSWPRLDAARTLRAERD